MTAIHSYHFATLDSTQRYLLAHPPIEGAIFCRAEQQSAGVGQRGAHWQSPQGGLYFSLAYSLYGAPQVHAGLAQACALVIAQTLDSQAKIIRLKWPNDLYIGERKLGGILIDMLPQADNSRAIIGIGINLQGNQDTIAYYQAHFPQIERQALYAQLQTALLNRLAQWSEKPYLAVNHRWNDYDRFYRQEIALETHEQPVQNLGIDQKGRLIVASAQGIEFLQQTRIRV